MSAEAERIRLDKWLWQARFYKTRGLAAEAAGRGRVRVNGRRVTKPAHALKLGDVLTFALAGRVRVVEILALGTRRGPATEAQGLYREIEEPTRPSADSAANPDAEGSQARDA